MMMRNQAANKRRQCRSAKNCYSLNGHLRLTPKHESIPTQPHVKMPNFTAEINMSTALYKKKTVLVSLANFKNDFLYMMILENALKVLEFDFGKGVGTL